MPVTFDDIEDDAAKPVSFDDIPDDPAEDISLPLGLKFKTQQFKEDFSREKLGELGQALQTSPLQFLPHIEDPDTSTAAAVGAKLIAPWAPTTPLTRRIAAGAIDTLQGGAEFATTPGGAALTIAGGGFPAVGRAIAAGFVPIMTKHAAETLGGASVTKDPREITRGVLEAGMAAAPLAHELPGVVSREQIKPSELRESDRGLARDVELRKQLFDDIPDDTIPQAPVESPKPEAPVEAIPAPVAAEPVQPAVEPVAEKVAPTVTEKPVEPPLEVDPTIKEMGADVYDANPESPGTYVSNMFAAIDKSRAEMGKPPMDPTVRRSWDADNQRALAQMNRNPDWVPDLIKEVADNPRPLLSWENAGMVWHRAKLKGQADNALSSLAQAFDDGRMADVESKKLEVARLEDQLDVLDKAVGRNGTGSEAGRSLVAQKMAAGEDFSLIEMRLKKRAANNGKPLTAQQEAEVQALHDKLAESERKLTELEAFKSKAIADAEIERIARETPRETFHPKVLEAAERIVQGFEARADAARARLREKLKTVGAGIDPTILIDVAEIGAGHLARKGLDFAKWSKVMIDEFGDAVKPYLEEAFKKSGEMLEEGTKRSNTMVKKAVKKVQTAGENIAEAAEAIAEKVKANKKNEITYYVQKLARAFVESGIVEREKLIDAVHSALTGVIPDITRRQAMDAISGYGDFKQLTKDQISVQLRGMKGEMQQIGKIEDMQAKTAPKKTGIERRTPTDEERRLQMQVNELKKAGGFTVTNPATQIRSALDSIKTRLRNQIKDLTSQIEKRQKIVKQKTPTPTDAETTTLRAQRDVLQKQFDDIFKPQVTDEQRIKMAASALERSIAEYERKIKEKEFIEKPSTVPQSSILDALRKQRDAARDAFVELRELDQEFNSKRSAAELENQKAALEKSIAEKEAALKAGRIAPKGTPMNRPADPAIEALKQRRDALNSAMAELRKKTPTEAERVAKEVARLNKLIAERQTKLDSGDLSTPGQPVNRPQVEEIEKAKQKLAEINKQIHERRNPPQDRDAVALKGYKRRLVNRIEELEAKLAAGDFTKTPRRTLELDNEANKLKVQAEKVKHDFRQALNRDKYANRTKFERGLDMLAKWRRGIVLSGLGTLEKLTSAAIARTITTPLEELAGEGLHRAFPELSKRAPRHGGGFSTKAEVKALSESVTAGMADAWQTLKTGKSGLEYIYKRHSDPGLPPTLIDVFGHIHGALKAPVKRAEFARSFEKRMQWNAERGVDVSDEFVQARIGLEAFQDAERSIFMQKNIVADAYKRMLQRFEQAEKIEGKPNPEGRPSVGGKALATTARVLLPIVKVPTNIVGEIMEYSIGSVTGSARLAKAYRAGVENLAPAEADLIMRHLKKGSLGAAALLIGFFNPELFGGFYQPGTKKKDAIKPDAARIGGVDIDSHFLHNPFVETSQLGATVRKVADSKLRKGDKEVQGLTAGAMAGALGLASEVPFIREMTEIDKLINPNSRNRWLGEFANSMVVPQGVREAAQFFDKDANGEVVKRKPTNVKEAVELGIPGLRQNVPKAKK